ncbi:hypothetical protein [Arthrobacter sp. zg-Y844]|uniref:hypothetical protein n=1 Tax=Arthrobacter sp. zg-Y844 TaxID=2964612 RepID=UPI002102D24F|nr:hypothetical protein [Arthrobacter sp. zg-Y844]MCQ1985998.1 hypothetical protein [Arthrobacter sp. zg-Y844]
MNSDKSEFQEVLVDVPKYDKNRKPIRPESFSSGGARNADGTLIAQYSNPRVPKLANEPASDERTSCEDDVRRRRAEVAEERRREEDFEHFLVLMDKYLIPFTKNYLLPAAAKLWETKGRPLWDTKVLPGGKRLAQQLFRPNLSEPEGTTANVGTPGSAAETTKPLAAQHSTDDAVETSRVQEAVEDTAVADVIQIDKYQDRRSA